MRKKTRKIKKPYKIFLIISLILFISYVSNNIGSYISDASSNYSDILSLDSISSELENPKLEMHTVGSKKSCSVYSEAYSSNINQENFDDIPEDSNVWVTSLFIEKALNELDKVEDKKIDKSICLKTSNINFDNINYVINSSDIEKLVNKVEYISLTNQDCITKININQMREEILKLQYEKVVISISKKSDSLKEIIHNIVLRKNHNIEFYGEIFDIYVYGIKNNKGEIISDINIDIKVKLLGINEEEKKKITSVLVDDDGKLQFIGGEFNGEYFEINKSLQLTFLIVKDIKKYEDIKESLARNEIEILGARGFFDKIDEGNNLFEPKKIINRGEFALIVSSIFRIKETEYKNSFKDIKEIYAYSSVVEGLKEANLMKGYGETFGGKDKLKREQMTVFIANAFKYSKVEMQKSIKEIKFKDENEISKFAKKDVSSVVDLGLLGYYEKNLFCPQKGMTREDVVSTLYKLMQALKMIK